MSEKGLSGLWYAKKKEWELVELPVYQPDDDEIVVIASERPVIQTTFNVALSE